MSDAVECLARRWSGDARPEGDQWRTRCPLHHGFTLLLRAGTTTPVIGHCFAGCSNQAVAAAISAALRGNYELPPVNRAPPTGSATDSERIARARRYWNSSSTDLTAIRVYLRHRGITLPPPPCLRFMLFCRHPSGQRIPAMIAAVECEGVGVTGVQRTFLRADGRGKANVRPAKASLGILRGGAVRLARAGETLALAEGIETALSFTQLERPPCWATLGAEFFEHVELPPLPLASRVILAIDNDAASEHGAREAARRFWHQGRAVNIARPTQGKDFNDLLEKGKP